MGCNHRVKQASQNLWLSLCLSVGLHALAVGVIQQWGVGARAALTARPVETALEVVVLEPAPAPPPAPVAKVAAAPLPVAQLVSPPAKPSAPVPPPIKPTTQLAESRPKPKPVPAPTPVPPAPRVEAVKLRVDPSVPAPPPAPLELVAPAANSVASKPAASLPNATPPAVNVPAAVAGPSAPVIAAVPTAVSATNGRAGGERAGVGQFTIALPEYRSNPAPIYPDSARRKRQEGVVWLMVEVSEWGDARAVAVERTSGYAALDDAALEAVRGWKFSPARQGDRAVAARVEVPVRFRLGN